MHEPLTDVEVRVLGSLIEKDMTTPDYYPLSLNALTAACNQSSNRDPVVSYDEETVSKAIEGLRRRALVRAVHRADSRVLRYMHLMTETRHLEPQEVALLGVLLLRGPQTVAELRARTGRMASFDSLEQVEHTLGALTEREGSPYVIRLPRRPGEREVRYAHAMAGEVTEATAPGPAPLPVHESPDRLARLEAEVQELKRQIADLTVQCQSFMNRRD